MDIFMRDSDAFSWYMERDPILRSTVVAIAWLEKSPDWDDLVSRVDQATRLIPMFRQRVLEPPGRLATPRWTFDHDFDLSWHVRRIEAPSPHTADTVVEFARQEAMSAFDRSRPLWSFTLIEQLEDGRAAFVMKLHHSLTDGIGGMQLALLLFDVEPAAARSTVLADVPVAEELDTAHLVRESLSWGMTRVSGFVSERAWTAIPAAVHVAGWPLRSAAAALDAAGSVARTVAPVRQTLSPIMQGRGLRRQLDLLEVDLGDLKRAAATVGGTVNDGFMAGVTGGLRRYHEHHGATVGNLRVTLPISIRTRDDPLGGNRITLMRFAVPVADSDPATRIPEIGRLCRRAQRERSLEFTNAIAGSLNLLPRSVVGAMLKHVDFLASNVPGFAFPIYLGGSRVERYTAFGPTIGASVNLTLLSYDGTCCIGVTLDSAAVPDREVFLACLSEGFEEVLALGGDHAAPRMPLHAPAMAGQRR
jgi:WS/DGAT/MGAT family acyltransferase